MGNLFLLVTYIALWIIVSFLLAAVFFLYRYIGTQLMGGREGQFRQGPELDSKVPLLRLTALGGEQFYLGGPSARPRLVFLATTECKPCQSLKGAFSTFARKYGDSLDVALVCRGSREAVGEFAHDLPQNIVIIADPRWDLGTKIRVHSTPFVFITDTAGVVRGKGNPRDEIAFEWFLEQLRDVPRTVQDVAYQSA